MLPSSYGRFDLWKRAAPVGLLSGFCVVASSTTVAGSQLDKSPPPAGLPALSGWPKSDSASEGEEPRVWFQPLYDDETSPIASGLETPAPGPAHIVESTTNQTDDSDHKWGQSAFEALTGLEGYCEDDWDMEGARAIAPEVIKIAAYLLQRVPEHAASPDIAPAADGTVCMEWVAPSGFLWVDVGSDRTAWILTKIDGEREEKRLSVDGKDFWLFFRSALERLYPPKRAEGFQAFFMAA